MAIQKKVVFAPEDVAAVRLLCGDCGQETGWRKGNPARFPDECPHCNISWRNLRPDTWEAARALHERLQALAFPTESPPFHVRMELGFDNPDEARGGGWPPGGAEQKDSGE